MNQARLERERRRWMALDRNASASGRRMTVQALLRRGNMRRGQKKKPELSPRLSNSVESASGYEQPLVDPQVSHFMQVPLRTMV